MVPSSDDLVCSARSTFIILFLTIVLFNMSFIGALLYLYWMRMKRWKKSVQSSSPPFPEGGGGPHLNPAWTLTGANEHHYAQPEVLFRSVYGRLSPRNTSLAQLGDQRLMSS